MCLDPAGSTVPAKGLRARIRSMAADIPRTRRYRSVTLSQPLRHTGMSGVIPYAASAIGSL
jgi:hypothetical protein